MFNSFIFSRSKQSHLFARDILGKYTDMDRHYLYFCYLVGFLFCSQHLSHVMGETQRKLVMVNAVSKCFKMRIKPKRVTIIFTEYRGLTPLFSGNTLRTRISCAHSGRFHVAVKKTFFIFIYCFDLSNQRKSSFNSPSLFYSFYF